MSSKTEHGFKWWIRYVIVPIIGSGGIIAIIVAIITNSTNSPPSIPKANINSTLPQIDIIYPANGENVQFEDFEVFGTSSNLSPTTVIWIFTGQIIQGEITRYWPQHGSPVAPAVDGTWQAKAFISDDDIGRRFEVYAVAVDDSETDEYLKEYVDAVDRNTIIPFLGFPPLTGFVVWDEIAVTRTDVFPLMPQTPIAPTRISPP